MNLRVVLGNLKTVGRSPSFSSNPGSTRNPGVDGPLAELRTIDLTQAKISPPQIDRIEQRILASLTDGSISDSDLGSLELTESEISKFFDEELAVSKGDFGTVLDPGSSPNDFGRSDPVDPSVSAGVAYRFALRRVSLVSLVSLLAISIGLLMSTRSMPGSVLYPVRLQAEAIRIAAADSDLQRAQRILAVADARVTMLGPDQTVKASQIVQVAGELENALVIAVGLVQSSKEDPELRIEVAGAIHGSAKAGIGAMSRRIPHTYGVSRISLENSISTTLDIAVAALQIYMGPGRAWVTPASSDGSETPTRAWASPQRHSRSARAASQTPVSIASSGPESEGKQREDPAVQGTDDCSVPSTTICITIPAIDLPVG